jgi:hypothetical protein
MNYILSSIQQAAQGAAAASPPSASAAVPDYGSDISCTDDADALFTERDGDDPLLVAEAVWRAITSPRGSIPGAPDVGWDIQSLLRSPSGPLDVRAWPRLVRQEVMRDDRVETCSVQFRQTAQDAWQVTVQGTTVSAGEFSLVGQLTPNAALLQEILAT